MTDKPVAAKIILNLAKQSTSGEDYISLSTALYQQNLIFSEPRELRRINNRLELIVTFQDIQSYKRWNKNAYILKYWNQKFKEELTSPPKTIKERDVILEVDNIRNCNCGKSEFYILQGRGLSYSNELNCGNCVKRIPYSKIPLEIEIDDWQRHYSRVYLNWLDYSFFEISALRELKNYKSGKLNTEGEKIRKQLSTHFNIPVYIEYFDAHLSNICLICGSRGAKTGLLSPSRVCKKCNVVFGYNV